MILTGEEIISYYRSGHIIIDPFVESMVQMNSVDVRITGPAYRLTQDGVFPYLKARRGSDFHEVAPQSVQDFIDAGRGSSSAQVWRITSAMDQVLREDGPVSRDSLGWYLEPGQYLFSTVEAIGTSATRVARFDDTPAARPMYIVPDIDAKSTFGRWGLTVSLCAGRGDVGFRSRWALEVRVAEPTFLLDHTVAGQVRFTLSTGHVKRFYGQGAESYQSSGTEDVIQLPKALKVNYL